MQDEKKAKVVDVLTSIKDTSIEGVSQSEFLKNCIEEIVSKIVEEGTAEIIGGIISAVVPHTTGVWLNYKQARFERNINRLLQELTKKVDRLDLKVENLDDIVLEKFKEEYSGWLIDNLLEEKQVDKVNYHINGFINMIHNGANDNNMLMFFDTMNQLTLLDIEVLRMYDLNPEYNIYELIEKYNLEIDHIRIIKEKLNRYGLLYSKNEDKRDKNLDEIVDYLKKVDSDNKKSRPQGVKVPSLKKISHSDSYSITSLGRNYLKLISE